MAERTKSQCEMCGKNVSTRTYTVQGARMNLCMDCSRFGDEYNDPRASSGSRSGGASDAVIQQRLEKREKRRQTKDIYAGSETTALREDYGKVIRTAREKTHFLVKFLYFCQVYLHLTRGLAAPLLCSSYIDRPMR